MYLRNENLMISKRFKTVTKAVTGVVVATTLLSTVGFYNAQIVEAAEKSKVEDTVILSHIKAFNEMAKEPKYIEFSTLDKLKEEAKKYSTDLTTVQENNKKVDFRTFKKGDKVLIGGEEYKDSTKSFKEQVAKFEKDRAERIEKERIEKERIEKERIAREQEQARLEAERVAREQAQAEVQYQEQSVSQPVAQTSNASGYTGQTGSAKSEIARRESTNNYNAMNGQYVGMYQLTDTYLNGDYSPENQERVADKYVADRYGSWENALAFHNANGWY